ncbi:MAG: hypothetical protein LBH85_03760 [Treponema sp.]|jgi:hypothetical protein|nr:hypothetical protein [Treponema sp.]
MMKNFFYTTGIAAGIAARCAAGIATGLILFFFSCSSAGSTPRKVQNPFITLDTAGEFEPLAKGGGVYLSIDAQESRPILDLLSFNGYNAKDAALILDKTAAITAALYPKRDGLSGLDGLDAPAFMLFARGSYPKGLADLSLGLAKDWKKTKSLVAPVSYWHSKTNKTALAFNKKYALISNVDPFSPTNALTEPGAAPPGGFAAFKRDAVIAGWLNDAGSVVNAFLKLYNFPFELEIAELFFKVSKETEAPALSRQAASGTLYNIEVGIESATEDEAMGLVGLFTLARMFIVQTDETVDLQNGAPFLMQRFFSSVPERDGASLAVNLGQFSAEQTALLFNLFAVN